MIRRAVPSRTKLLDIIVIIDNQNNLNKVRVKIQRICPINLKEVKDEIITGNLKISLKIFLQELAVTHSIKVHINHESLAL
jgi:hypothetical protein